MAGSGGLVCDTGFMISCRNVVFLVPARKRSRCDYDDGDTIWVQKKVGAQHFRHGVCMVPRRDRE